MKSIAILGSTGSIGRQTLDIVQAHTHDLKVVALAAGSKSVNELARQVMTFKPELVSVADAAAAQQLKEALSSAGRLPEILCGEDGLNAVATHPGSQTLVTGVVGFLGLIPTAKALAAGKTVALANKETLVAAGNVIMPMAETYGGKIIPVDSEHSAIFQSLGMHSSKDIHKILLTGSGGPFRTWDRDKMSHATVDDALRHPNWSMGPKITVDSATLMNKGLEIIEARWLFGISPRQIEVLIHPQSILHSAVEFVDGSVVGQMGLPDMRLPIHYALFFPERMKSTSVPRLDLIKLQNLTFEAPDLERFPCLALARQVASHDNTLACVLNAANEIAVEAFLQGQIRLTDIASSIEQVLNQHTPVDKPSLEDILEVNRWARQAAKERLQTMSRQVSLH